MYKMDDIMQIKKIRRGRVKEYLEKYPDAVYTPADEALGYNPLWNHEAECAYSSATQNAINDQDAQNLINNSVYVVSEGADMPTIPDAMIDQGII